MVQILITRGLGVQHEKKIARFTVQAIYFPFDKFFSLSNNKFTFMKAFNQRIVDNLKNHCKPRGFQKVNRDNCNSFKTRKPLHKNFSIHIWNSFYLNLFMRYSVSMDQREPLPPF